MYYAIRNAPQKRLIYVRASSARSKAYVIRVINAEAQNPALFIVLAFSEAIHRVWHDQIVKFPEIHIADAQYSLDFTPMICHSLSEVEQQFFLNYCPGHGAICQCSRNVPRSTACPKPRWPHADKGPGQ